MLAYLIGAHLIGDFLFQNHWMQRKSQSSWVCTCHVFVYGMPFFFLAVTGLLPFIALAFILVEHWLQDRFALHLKWMRLYEHTTVDKWPVGPLCVDQAMHVGFMWLVALLCAAYR